MVFDDPPAPAALVEFGRDTCEDPAARLLNTETTSASLFSEKHNPGFQHT